MGEWWGCWEEPKHVEDLNKAGLRQCCLCINKTGATGDNVVTAQGRRKALREDTSETTPSGNKSEFLKNFLDHKTTK